MTSANSGDRPATASASAPAQYLTFNLSGESYAIGILAIKEIIEYRPPTAVPTMPASARGVINLRGAVVPVLDPMARFGLPASTVGKRSCIVIVEVVLREERQVVGVLVDAVSEVLEIPASDIEPPPGFGARIRGDFIAGIGKVRGKFVILLAVDRVLELGELGGAPAAGALAGTVVAEAADEDAAPAALAA